MEHEPRHGSRIVGLGSYLPNNIVTNEAFEDAALPYSEELQSYFDGVTKRRHASPSDSAVYMGARAVEACLRDANVHADEVDLLIYYSMFPDHAVPHDGNFIARDLGLRRAVCWQMDAACSTFLLMLKVADTLLTSGHFRNALLVTSNNWVGRGFDTRRDIRCLGDGAATVLLQASAEGSLIGQRELTDASRADFVFMNSPLVTKKDEVVVFKRQSEKKEMREYHRKGIQLAKELMAESKVFPADVTWFLCHQPGATMQRAWCEELEMSPEKNLTTIGETGNLSAANIPFVLAHFVHRGVIKRGDTLLLFALGGGFHFITMLWRY